MPRASKTQPAAPTGPRLVRKSTSKPSIPFSPSDHDIAIRAYEIYEQEGCQHGHHEAHWFRAERELIDAAPVRPVKRVAGTRARR